MREIPVSGCTIIRSSIGFDYPLEESIRSLLPLVEEVVVVAHRGDALARETVRALDDSRVTIVETDWDDGPSGEGRVLARQTNVALQRCRHAWVLYLQADEVLHEAEHEVVRGALARYHDVERVDALTFRFLHFEGAYDLVNPFRYRRQCRLVRNDGRLESVGDAAGFGRRDGRRLRTRESGARIFHYGWARPPAQLKAKTLALASLYSDEAQVARRWGGVPADRLGRVELAFRWRGAHPVAMHPRIARMDWRIPEARRPPLDTPLLSLRFYAAWLGKWGLMPRRWWL